MTAALARTLLFVPGDRPDRFDKAAAAGADLVVLDLEDAVAPHEKERARDEVVAWLRTATVPAAVRVNAVDSPWHDADRAVLAGRASTVVLPKAQDPTVVAAVVASLGDGSSVIALLETARGILRAEAIAAVPGVVRLALGTYDLAAGLGVDPDDPAAMAAARGALVLASAAAGLAGPVDGVTGDVRDTDRLVADVLPASALPASSASTPPRSHRRPPPSPPTPPWWLGHNESSRLPRPSQTAFSSSTAAWSTNLSSTGPAASSPPPSEELHEHLDR